MADRELSCGCSVLENTSSAKLDGTLLKLCKLHVDWMTGIVLAEREACAALTDAWPDRQKYTADRYSYGTQMATELADAIRARNDL